MWLFLHSYILVCVLISAEVITLIKEDKIACVLTEDSVNSTIYISNLDSLVTLNRTSEEITNINNNDWTPSNSSDKFHLILDERWTSFRRDDKTRLSDKKTFSVYLQPKTTISINDVTHHDLTTIPIGNIKSSDNSSFGQWHHYDIIRSTNTIKLKELEVDTIYNEMLKDQPEWITFPQNANYKLHKYNFLYSNTTSKSESYIKISTLNCIALYVSVDEGCYLNISVQPTNKIITVDGFNKKYDLKEWKKYEIRTEPDGNEQTLSFYRGRKDNSIEGYWAIDDIHSCSSQTVIYKTSVDQLWNNHTCMELNRTDSSNTFCDNASFGKQCHIKCDEILGSSYPNCEEHRICLSENNCHCAWGHYGENCKEDCKENFWGLDCKEQCTNCDEKCDRKIGCQKCKAKFFGTHCTNELPVVTKAPTLQTINDNTIQILINLNYEKKPNTASPKSYIIQTKKIGSNAKFENSTIQDFPTGTESATHSLNLIRDFSYQIRTILTSDNLSFQDDTVPVLVVHKKSLLGHFKEDDTIALTWSAPDNKTSNSYYIEFKCLKPFCYNETEAITKTTEKNEFKLENTKHFKMCNIRLFITKDGNNKLIDETTIATQTSSESIVGKELPKNITVLKNQIVLEFEECNSFSGPLNYSVIFNCISNWCTNDSSKIISFDLRSYKDTHSIDVGNLIPFTDYDITVIARRNGQDDRNQNYSRKSTPSKPHAVKELFLYSTDNDYLYIRWKKAYPPTGQIETYTITTQYNTSISISNFTNSSCEIWNEFLCASIPRDKNFHVYNITIKSKNYDVPEWSQAASFTGNIENVTSAPQNLQIALNPESSNEIVLSWEYPDYTYGKIVKFQTIINPDKDNKTVSTTVSNKTNYQETIPIDYGKAYNITVWAQNGHDGKTASIYVITSKPIPQFSTQPFVIWCDAKCHLIVPKSQRQEVKSYNIIIEQNIKTVRKKEAKTLNDQIVCTESNSPCDIHIDSQDVTNQTYNLNINSTKTRIDFTTNVSSTGDVITGNVITGNVIAENVMTENVLIIIIIVTSITLFVILLIGLIIYKCKRQKRIQKKTKVTPSVKFSELREKEALVNNNDQNETSFQSIKMNDFAKYFLTSLDEDPDDNRITQQFQTVPRTRIAHCSQGQLSENIDKNRYKNVLPYDDTRVIMRANEEGNYINANYVDGYDIPKVFIAAQAPLPTTVHDFWYMIWQENVKVIVMLTEIEENGRIKSEKYWPEDRSRFRFGNFLIESVSLKMTSHYIHREFQVIFNKQIRLVDHFQYIAWPDHGVPLYIGEYTAFIKHIMKIEQYPIVVHCNAGCGRTGTFILCDILIRMGIKEKKLDFFGVLKRIRNQRGGLVSNVEQYIFAHYVIMEYFFGQDFSISVGDNFEAEVENALNECNVKHIIKCLAKTREQYERTHFKTNIQLTDEEKSKNRFPKILPGHSQIYLPVSSRDTSNYINAVTVDCYQCPKKFIVTQQPLPNTLEDFWKLTQEYDIDTILSLNKITDNDQNCPRFWPNEIDQTWTLGTTTLTFFSEETDNTTYNLIRIKIGSTTTEKTKNVIIIDVKNWRRKTNKPSNIRDLIYLWQKIMTCRGQIIVTCYDGVTASGLFVALAFMLEKMNLDHSCDVFTAVRNVRHSRAQFVEHAEQLKCLYYVALEYIREFSIYKNFN